MDSIRDPASDRCVSISLSNERHSWRNNGHEFPNVPYLPHRKRIRTFLLAG
jgi:hypothetical protein